METGDEPHGGLDPVALPVVDASFVYPDLFRDLLLEQSQIKSLRPDVVAIGL